MCEVKGCPRLDAGRASLPQTSSWTSARRSRLFLSHVIRRARAPTHFHTVIAMVKWRSAATLAYLNRQSIQLAILSRQGLGQLVVVP
jgi:hypothetical protein